MRLAIIPARGGSVRIPRKNIRNFHGKPIIAYSIETAQFSGLFDSVIVSTDDDEIEAVAQNYGAAVFRRPFDDGAKGTQEVAADVLMALPNVTLACVIYPTCPLLHTSDLQAGLDALEGHQFAMSVADPLVDIGCFYWGQADAFRYRLPLIATHTAIVPLSRAIDINTPEDWTRAEELYTTLYQGKP